MIRFRFQAIDAQGKWQQGVLDAPGEDDARSELENRGLTPLTLEPATSRGAWGARALSEREVVELLEQLQTLTRSGSPLPGGLRAASSEIESAPLRATFARLADHLDQGRALDAALLDEAGQFPAHLQGLVRAGARTGRLGEILGEVVQGSNLGHELRRRVWVSLSYPALVLGVVLALSIFICHLSSQISFEFDVLTGFGIRRPTLAVAMAAITRFVAEYDVWALPGLAVAGGVIWLGWRIWLPAPQRRRLLESVPLYGPLLRFVALAEFCHLTALLVEAETPLPEALNLAGGSVRNPGLAATCRQIAVRVAEGESLTASLRGWTGLPASLGQLLAWGEASQELAGALRFAGDLFEARAEAQASYASHFVGGAMLILILWWVGFAVAAIYLPITSVIQLLSALAG